MYNRGNGFKWLSAGEKLYLQPDYRQPGREYTSTEEELRRELNLDEFEKLPE